MESHDEKPGGRRRTASPVIAHADMDAYFVEVELLERPQLRGRRLIVAHDSPRSVVLSASYPARADGVRSGMPLVRARRLSPGAMILEPHPPRYRELSARIMAHFGTLTDRVEQLSVDEAFLDLTGAVRRLGPPDRIGEQIRREIRDEFGLPCTVGIADRKFVAKIASTRAKPDGLMLVPPARRLPFLHALPVEALWGVGGTTADALHGRGIRTVAQLAETPRDVLRARFGRVGEHLHDLAWGIDDREVEPEREEKSIGAEETFAVDLTSTEALRAELLRLSHRIAARLRAADLSAAGVSLKLRYRDFQTLTRSSGLSHPTRSAPVLHRAATRLLDRLGDRPQPVRLIGLRAERLSRGDGGVQLSFDGSESRWTDAEAAVDTVARRFPEVRLGPASLIRRDDDDSEAQDESSR
ncbi:DNA polymerase IV [Nesterenkonia marinintestina]|uniref:DNA polymerase IV n=1 Tax=Nesterenkonia marinintestina TaxID=2979865 RepID=UPI0021BEC3F7|nr:DNA polymerase IV [Nesterenkonia sp. GX14115]